MQNKEINLIATVDIKPKFSNEHAFSGIEHRVRTQNQPLSKLLDDLKEKNPIVILGDM